MPEQQTLNRYVLPQIQTDSGISRARNCFSNSNHKLEKLDDFSSVGGKDSRNTENWSRSKLSYYYNDRHICSVLLYLKC